MTEEQIFNSVLQMVMICRKLTADQLQTVIDKLTRDKAPVELIGLIKRYSRP